MGIDSTCLEAILSSVLYCFKKSSVLTLGRQQIHTSLTKYNHGTYSEGFFKDLGFESVDSMDASAYEGASILHNLNYPLAQTHTQYSFLYDGGTTEHIFNVAQVYENVVELLDVGGIFCGITPNNNQSGHGMFQFSPEFFLSIFTPKYGMKINNLWIARVGDSKEKWIDVNSHDGYRNVTKFNDTQEVYCIVIAQKISNERASFLKDPPNQFSYESIEWRK